MSPEQIHSYLRQLDLTAWINRDTFVAPAKPAADESATSSKAADKPVGQSPSQPKPTSPREQLLAERVDDGKAKVAPTPDKTATPARVKTVAQATTRSNNKSLKMGGITYQSVVVLYTPNDQGGLSQDENRLLESMLAKAGIANPQYAVGKRRLLVYPPTLPLPTDERDEKLSGAEELQQACTGFLGALANSAQQKLAGQSEIFLLVLGKNNGNYLPQDLAMTPILLDDLASMLKEPARRKDAWEALLPLRKALAPK